MRGSKLVRLGIVVAVGLLFLAVVNTGLPPSGSFPENRENAPIGQLILENAPTETGAANVVTSVVWGYRGYDTFGEATVLFTAVVGVLAVLRAVGRER